MAPGLLEPQPIIDQPISDKAIKPAPSHPRKPPHTPIKAFIFDLGDVLLKWTAPTHPTIPPSLLKKIMTSPPWYKYECALISQKECYEQAASLLSVPADEIAQVCRQALDSLYVVPEVESFIKSIKQTNEGVKVYAMSNVAHEDFVFLREKMEEGLFERVFTSAGAGMRKPDARFYEMVLESLREVGVRSEECVFVDDKKVNVEAAGKLGMRGVVFGDVDVGVNELRGTLKGKGDGC